jgi:hypothetical protein
MKLKLSELKSNPYKKYINEGKLSEEQIENISKNLDTLGLMGSIPIVKRDDKYYIVNCHHRIEALKRKFGKDYEVEVTLHKYDDAQLLQGMVIENLTQRQNDFREELENCLAVKNYLEMTFVRSSDKTMGRPKEPASARDISSFLNDVICKSKVAELLRVYERIPKEMIEEATHKQGEFDSDILRYDQIVTLSKLENKQEIKDLAKALKNSNNQRVLDHRNFINQYIIASDDVKQKVRKGEIDIADIEGASLNQDIKDYNEKNPRSEFIPNFASRLKQFDKDVYILEKQVKAFSMVFHDKRFKEKYSTLKPKQQESLHFLIHDISKRVRKCYEEVEYFREALGVPSDETLIGLIDGGK